MRPLLCIASAAILVAIIWFADHAEWQFIFAWIRDIPGGDKLCHFLLIGGFAFVVNWTLRGRTFKLARRDWLLGSAIVLVLCTLEELWQIWLPSRSFDLVDFAANWLGILAFGWLARRVLHVSEPGNGGV